MGEIMAIVVQEIEGGEFHVIKGGDVYRGRGVRAKPGNVYTDEIVSAAEICEWVDNGIEIVRIPNSASALVGGFRK